MMKNVRATGGGYGVNGLNDGQQPVTLQINIDGAACLVIAALVVITGTVTGQWSKERICQSPTVVIQPK